MTVAAPSTCGYHNRCTGVWATLAVHHMSSPCAAPKITRCRQGTAPRSFVTLVA